MGPQALGGRGVKGVGDAPDKGTGEVNKVPSGEPCTWGPLTSSAKPRPQPADKAAPHVLIAWKASLHRAQGAVDGHKAAVVVSGAPPDCTHPLRLTGPCRERGHQSSVRGPLPRPQHLNGTATVQTHRRGHPPVPARLRALEKRRQFCALTRSPTDNPWEREAAPPAEPCVRVSPPRRGGLS